MLADGSGPGLGLGELLSYARQPDVLTDQHDGGREHGKQSVRVSSDVSLQADLNRLRSSCIHIPISEIKQEMCGNTGGKKAVLGSRLVFGCR